MSTLRPGSNGCSGSAVEAKVSAELPEREQGLVPTIVQLELATWLTREVGEDKADRVIAFTTTCLVADLDTAIALSAADLCARHKLATADAVVYGTDLLTCDRPFDGLSKVCFIPKTNG